MLLRVLVGAAFLRAVLPCDDAAVRLDGRLDGRVAVRLDGAGLGRYSTSDLPAARLADALILFQPAMLLALTP